LRDAISLLPHRTTSWAHILASIGKLAISGKFD